MGGSSWGGSLTALNPMQNRGGGAAELPANQGHAREGGAAGAAQVHLRPPARAPARWLPAAGFVPPAQGGGRLAVPSSSCSLCTPQGPSTPGSGCPCSSSLCARCCRTTGCPLSCGPQVDRSWWRTRPWPSMSVGW